MTRVPALGEGHAPRTGAISSRWFRLAATLTVAAVTWMWLARHAELGILREQAERVPVWVWLAAAAAQLAGYALRAGRLRTEWRSEGSVRWLACMRLVLLHNAAVLMLPLRSGEAGYVWLVHRTWCVGLAAAGWSLLRWRIQDASVLGLLAVALLLPVDWPWRVLALAASIPVLTFALPGVWSWLAARREVASAQAASLWRGAGITAAQWACKFVSVALVLSALAELEWPAALRAALGGELAGAQPLQPPAGFGVYEGGVWIGAGAPTGSAVVTAALAAHAFSLCVALGAAAMAQLFLPAGEGRAA